MKIGITLDDDKGLDGLVCAHFGQCRYFLIVDVENKEIKNAQVFPINAQHGGGGCLAVNEILKYGISHVISGGMGMGAQQKFVQAGIKVFGYSGNAKSAVEALISNTLGGLDSCCGEHGACH